MSLFYIYHPTEKQSLQAHFRFLSGIRNQSLHAASSSFHVHEVERIAYLALKVFQLSEQHKEFKNSYRLNTDDTAFLKSFDENRVERVRKKIEEAKSKTKTIHGGKSSLSVDAWDMYATELNFL